MDKKADCDYELSAQCISLTNASDPLCHQVLEHGVDDRVVTRVELVAVYSYVEAEPVGIGVRRQLSVLGILSSILGLGMPWERDGKRDGYCVYMCTWCVCVLSNGLTNARVCATCLICCVMQAIICVCCCGLKSIQILYSILFYSPEDHRILYLLAYYMHGALR